jgi:hypothetical protein
VVASVSAIDSEVIALDDEEKRNAAIGRSRFARRPEAIWASGRVREGADAVAVPGDEGEFAKAGMLSREGRAGSCKGWPESCPVIVGAKGGSVLPLISTLSGEGLPRTTAAVEMRVPLAGAAWPESVRLD